MHKHPRNYLKGFNFERNPSNYNKSTFFSKNSNQMEEENEEEEAEPLTCFSCRFPLFLVWLLLLISRPKAFPSLSSFSPFLSFFLSSFLLCRFFFLLQMTSSSSSLSFYFILIQFSSFYFLIPHLSFLSISSLLLLTNIFKY